MSKKISDFFSPEARAARREARLNKVSSLSGTVGTNLGQRFAAKEARITTQNVGPHGLALVREILANYRLPGVPKLGYSGLRNGRTAANSTRLQDGVVTITASFRTYSNVGISFDVPIEIRDGVMQEPSVIVHNGAPRIIAQSTFDDLVSMNTMRDVVPVREMYSEPLPNAVAKKVYKERVEMPRIDRGMFSVDANKRNLRAAIRGTAQELPSLTHVETWGDDSDPDGIVAVFSDGMSMSVYTKQGYINLVDTNTADVVDKSDCSYPSPKSAPYIKAIVNAGHGDWLVSPANMPPATASKTAQVQVSPKTQPMPTLKKQMPSGSAWQDMNRPDMAPIAPDADTAVRQHQQVQPSAQPAQAAQPAQPASNVPAQLGQMAQQLGQMAQQLSQQKQAKEKDEKSKTPKLKAPKLPKLKAPPSTSRLCAKCSSAPCKCPNKRKKKEAIYRPIVAQMDMVSKVQAEVEQMRGDGLGDIDIKQAIFKKYGPGIAASIFPGE